jgi:ankyrin repeat protein
MFRGSPCCHVPVRCILRCEHSRTRQLFVDLDIQLFEDGAHVDYADINGWANVFDASYRGDLKAVSFLLENGADVDCTAING